MKFLVENNFYQCHDRKERADTGTEGKVKNFIFAHNGMNFDMRFVIDKLITLLGDIANIGDMNTMKACKVKGVTFYDTCLVIT